MSKSRSKRPVTAQMTDKEVRTSAKRSGMRRHDDERIDWQQIVWEMDEDGVATIAESFNEQEA